MKLKLLTAVIMLLSLSTFAQQGATWSKWQWLIGDWVGEGSGKPGQGSGIFSFKSVLNEKILMRKSRSEYPAKDGKPAFFHDDLMIVYLDYSGTPSKAIYFDNEGHNINYSIVYEDKSIVLTSEKISNVPIFRLTYTLLDDGMVNTKFEMSQDGVKYMTYVEGKSKKVK